MLKLDNVIIQFAHIYEPHSVNDKEAKYSACFIIPKAFKEQVEAIKKEIEAVKVEAMQRNPKWRPKHLPLRDGDDERPENKTFADSYFMNASSKFRPIIIGRDKKVITEVDAVYNSCTVNVLVKFFPFDKNGSSGILCNLGNIQKVADGELIKQTFDPTAAFSVL